MYSKVPLVGAELEEYLQKQREERDKAAATAAANERRQRLLEADAGDDSDSEDGSDAADEEDVERELADTQAGGDEWEDGARLTFDIYLKGNVARGAASFFRAAPREGRGYRMFPYVEKRHKVDAYGEVPDVAAWLRRGREMEEAENADAPQRPIEEDELKARAF